MLVKSGRTSLRVTSVHMSSRLLLCNENWLKIWVREVPPDLLDHASCSLWCLFFFPKPTLRYLLRIMPSWLDFTLNPNGWKCSTTRRAKAQISLSVPRSDTHAHHLSVVPRTSWNAAPYVCWSQLKGRQGAASITISLCLLAPCLLSHLAHVCFRLLGDRSFSLFHSGESLWSGD